MKRILGTILFLALAVLFAAAFTALLPPSETTNPPSSNISLRGESLPVRSDGGVVRGSITSPPPENSSSQAPIKKKSLAASNQIPAVKIVTPPPPSNAPASPPNLSDPQFYDRYASAVIQVFCMTPEEYFSASGVIVNDRGLVLTNAHVAEIMQKVGVQNCQARHGNPANAFASLEVVFSADTNAKINDTKVPQHDFAFLKLVNHREAFHVADLTLDMAPDGQTVLTLGYPSEFLEGNAAADHANLVFSLLVVDGLTNFDSDHTTADGYIFQGGIALQQGSSGTPIFDRSGNVLAIIFATTKASTTADREGVAIMTSAIDRELVKEVGMGLADFVKSH